MKQHYKRDSAARLYAMGLNGKDLAETFEVMNLSYALDKAI